MKRSEYRGGVGGIEDDKDLGPKQICFYFHFANLAIVSNPYFNMTVRLEKSKLDIKDLSGAKRGKIYL